MRAAVCAWARANVYEANGLACWEKGTVANRKQQRKQCGWYQRIHLYVCLCVCAGVCNLIVVPF